MAISAFVTFLDFVMLFSFLVFSFIQFAIDVYALHQFGLCLMLIVGYAFKRDLVVGRF